MFGAKGVLLKLIVAFLLTLFCIQIAWAHQSDFQKLFDNKRIDYRGYTYQLMGGDADKYEKVHSINNEKYDSKGRVISFTAYNDNGVVLFNEHLTYSGEKIYDSDGNFVGVAYNEGDLSAPEKAQKDATKTEVRNIIRVVQNRTASILITNPKADDKVVAMKKRLKDGAVVNLMARSTDGASQQLAYHLENNDNFSGMSAGEFEEKLGLSVWMSGAVNWFGNTKAPDQYDGVSVLAMGGVDYLLSSRTVIGVSIGLEGAYMDTDFWSVSGKQGNAGLSVNPYISIELFENMIFDLVSSLTWSEYGSTIDAYHNGFRFMLSPNVTQYFFVDSWQFSGTLGFAYAREDFSEYYGSANLGFFDVPEGSAIVPLNQSPKPVEMGEIKVGGKVGYMFSFAEPYLTVNYLYDIMETQEDPDEVEAILGCDFYPTDSFIVGLEVGNSFFRENTYNVHGMLNLRYEF